MLNAQDYYCICSAYHYGSDIIKVADTITFSSIMLKYCDNDVERLPKVKYFEILILSSEGITREETGERLFL